MPSKQKLLEIIKTQTEIVKLGLDLNGVMSLVVERLLPLLDADGAAIEFSDGDDMVYQAATGIARSFVGLRLKLKSSLSGLCLQTGETLYCPDTTNDSRVDREACDKIGLRSMVVMPLQHHEVSVAVIKVMSKQKDKFSPSDIKALALISDLIAAAMFFATKYDNDNLYYKATHDGLTQVANRSLFMDRLRSSIDIHTRSDTPLAILIIDMDDLKVTNDTFGHRAGDAALQELAERIKICTRSSDLIARLGGDEFGVILSPIVAQTGTSEIIQRLEDEISREFIFEDSIIPFKASIGHAEFPLEHSDIDDLIDLADTRMYTDKTKNKSESSNHEILS